MGVIAYNEADVKLLARLMRAEAEGEGQQGMLMVGNVGVNRVRGNCLDFKKIRNLRQMVYQNPGGFEATQKGYFYQRAREQDIALARRTIQGQRFGLQILPYGFLDLKAPVHQLGIINKTLVASKSTASSSHLARIVLAYIKD